MKPITEFHKATCRELGAELAALVSKWAAERGLSATSAGGSFDAIKFDCKIELRVLDQAKVDEVERKTFGQYCGLFDLTPEHFGTVVTIKGEQWRLCGLAINRSKYPFKFQNVATGKISLFGEIAADRIKAAAALKTVAKNGSDKFSPANLKVLGRI